MTHSAIERRIFIVGVPRSGTTLVQSLLASHTAMTSFTESHFFRKNFSRVPLLSLPILTRDPRSRLYEFLAENGEEPPPAAEWFAESERWPLRVRPLLPFQTLPVARQLVRVLDEIALKRGAINWIEKTPWHLRFISLLERASPGRRPHFIHVIRNGLEVVASLHRASRQWERSYDLESCVARWNGDLEHSLNRISSPNDQFVAYEQLTSDPEGTVKRLLDGLGLAWEPSILERYGSASEKFITAREDWKNGVGRRIHRSATSAEVLTPEQTEWVTARLDHDLYDRILDRSGGPKGSTSGAA
ncbi:MAG: sulfotransferase [Acidobacteriota bacterium]|jgi:hypothetical protein|nr:sulfotransferase [Acidobacteriota bacterium]